jgi:hypothetical protein
VLGLTLDVHLAAQFEQHLNHIVHMKKFLSMLAIAALVTSFWSCDDDEAEPDAPTITAPAVTNVQVETPADVTFAVTVPGGYKSVTVTGTGGAVAKKSEPTAGATSGNVVVTYTADANAGAGSVSITVTDNNDKTSTQNGVINKTAEPGPEVVDVNFNIDENTTWETGKIYVLRGRIAVTNGATLTIQPGVVVKGDAGTDANAKALIIARGSKIMAEGTADSPIIFTSIQDEIVPGEIESPNMEPDQSGLWGGLIVLGSARISTATGGGDQLTEAQIEGIPTSDSNGLYGGDNDADNSGVLKYISIRHGGTLIGSGNEINGLTLGGVGSGTVIENIEVVANQDDGIEWFGGTVSVKNVVVWNSFDDGLDTDMGWNGVCDNFIIVAPNTGSAFELDGPEGNYINAAKRNHEFTNGTVYAGANIADLIDFDANTNVQMDKIYFYGFSNATAVKEYAAMIAFAGSSSSVANFQHTLTGATNPDPAVVFLGIPADKLTAVAVNANTVGADVSVFDWTWAGVSGALAAVGL